jgi:hypothetical protein
MAIGTIITMVLVLGIIWGGFAYFLRQTLNQEREE